MNIKLENISKRFHHNLIFENVNLELKSGKIYGFIGPNGSGKSVLFKIMCGFYQPTSGTVLYNGIDIHKKNLFPPDTRALIEKPNFLPNLTGFENLSLLSSIQKKIGESEILETLKLVHLDTAKNQKFHEYSVGMKQKLGIAQVLMEDPEVMIFDEPMSGIEEDTVEELRALLLKERDRGKLIIIASHSKEEINLLADEVYQIKNQTIQKVEKKTD